MFNLILIIALHLLPHQHKNFVNDNSNTLTSTQINFLLRKMDYLNGRNHFHYAIIFQNIDIPIETFALGAIQDWDPDDGVLIIINTLNNTVRLETGFNVQKSVSDDKAMKILQKSMDHTITSHYFMDGVNDILNQFESIK